jgi:hypothetical protein
MPVEVPDPPRPLGVNPTLSPEYETSRPRQLSPVPEELEPTESLESVEELEATEFISNRDTADRDGKDSPLASLLTALQPSEIAGIGLGLLFAVLGMIYLFTRLWS